MTSSERRVRDRRAATDRRRIFDDLPSSRMDVTRLEHENLCRQIDHLVRLLERIEISLHQQTQRIDQLDTDFRALLRDRSIC
jgi:hypothetical protein